MLNIHDSEEAYEACRQHIQQRQVSLAKQTQENYDRIYTRVKEINENEKRIIEAGRVPQEFKSGHILYNTTEAKILNRMLGKYVKVV